MLQKRNIMLRFRNFYFCDKLKNRKKLKIGKNAKKLQKTKKQCFEIYFLVIKTIYNAYFLLML